MENELHIDPCRSTIYLFCGRRCDRVKNGLIENLDKLSHPVGRGVADPVILLICVAGCIIVFVLFWKYDKDEIYKQWTEIRDEEASEE